MRNAFIKITAFVWCMSSMLAASSNGFRGVLLSKPVATITQLRSPDQEEKLSALATTFAQEWDTDVSTVSRLLDSSSSSVATSGVSTLDVSGLSTTVDTATSFDLSAFQN